MNAQLTAHATNQLVTQDYTCTAVYAVTGIEFVSIWCNEGKHQESMHILVRILSKRKHDQFIIIFKLLYSQQLDKYRMETIDKHYCYHLSSTSSLPQQQNSLQITKKFTSGRQTHLQSWKNPSI